MYAAPQPQGTVYIVDDDFAIRDSLKALLEAFGFAPKVFGSGAELLDVCPRAADGCVLLDVCLPERDGFGVLADLRQEGITLPVVLITAHDERAHDALAESLGAFAVLRKPLNDDELLKVVTQALGGEMEVTHTNMRQSVSHRPGHANRRERNCRPSHP